MKSYKEISRDFVEEKVAEAHSIGYGKGHKEGHATACNLLNSKESELRRMERYIEILSGALKSGHHCHDELTEAIKEYRKKLLEFNNGLTA